MGRPLPARTRLLDPTRPGPNTVPTAYNQEGLIVSVADSGAALAVADALRDALRDQNCDFEGPDWLRRHDTGPSPSGPPQGSAATATLTSGVKMRPLAGSSGLPDPWSVLTALRTRADPAVVKSVSLNHILTVAEQPGGNPFAIGHGRVGLDSYGVPGQGARGPVTFVGQPPRRAVGQAVVRVVVLDTAVGEHPWLAGNIVTGEFTMSDGRVVGQSIHPYPRDDGRPAVQDPIPDPLVGAVGSHTGHATFICGLLRQACPQADIVALPLMGTDGVVPEHMLIRALDLVLTKQLDEPGWADAVVLSLGYYNESPEDVDYSSGLKKLLVKLGEVGVAVFVAAGNDATDRPSYPAAFAVDPEFAEPNVLPLMSVAALNPDGSLAQFSNDGAWVTAAAVGVNVVSCAPNSLDGSMLAGVRRGSGRHAAIDLDNYRGGFAAWSGTSFAAPVLAGRYLRSLTDDQFLDTRTGRRELLRGLRRPARSA